jgi:hypothetical protein
VKYHNGEIASEDAATRSIVHTTPDNFACNHFRAAVCLAHTEKFDAAFAETDKINIPDIILAHFADLLVAFRILVDKSKFYNKYIELYNRINDSFLHNKLIEEMDNYYISHKSEQADFRKALIETGSDIPFVRLMGLIETDLNTKNSDTENAPDIKDKISEYFNSLKDFEAGHAEAVYLAIKHKVYIDSKIISLSTYENIHTIFNLINYRHSDYISIITEYFEIENFTESITTMFFGMTMLEKAVYGAQYIAPMLKEKLYSNFTGIVSDYVVNIYNADLLNAADIVILPELHRFGYYMSLAGDALAADNKVEYIKNLRNALDADSDMRDVISFLTKKFKEEIL